MRIFNKLVFSKKEPSNKNDIWFDGKNWKVFIEGEWKDTSKVKEDATTPDWNAQEGEAGYIKNKPFYSKGDIRQIDVDGEYTIQAGKVNIGDRIDVSWDLEYYDGEILRGSTSFVIEEGVYTYYEKDNFNIYVSDYNFELYAHGFSGGESHYGKVTVVVNGEIKTLDEKYLPDTVLKTTPQELSDTDKNQALANLGIDPVVWKYMCEPYIIESESHIPDYLHQLLVNNNPLILNLCKIKVVTEIYDEYADANRPIIHLCTPIAYKFDDEPDRALSLQCITFYDNTYHTYRVEIDESDGQIYDITEIVPNENNS